MANDILNTLLKSTAGDPNDPNDPNIYDAYESEGLDPSEIKIPGPYGPEWPLVHDPIEFDIGDTHVEIRIEDENAKMPLIWAMTTESNRNREAEAAFETFCEWMQMPTSEIEMLKDQVNELSGYKQFKLELKPITYTEQTEVVNRALPTSRSSATSRSTISRTTTRTVKKTRPAIAHTTDFAKLLHSSVLDTDQLAWPIPDTGDRYEAPLKYLALWGSQQVNINTAPRHVLEAAFTFGGYARKIAQEIILLRQEKPFKDIDELKKKLYGYNDSIRKVEPYITTRSTFFAIKVTATTGSAIASAVATVVREGKREDCSSGFLRSGGVERHGVMLKRRNELARSITVEQNNCLGYTSPRPAGGAAVGQCSAPAVLGCVSVTVTQGERRFSAAGVACRPACRTIGLGGAPLRRGLREYRLRMYTQHNLRSDFTEYKQIANTIMFDAEEALARDATEMALTFSVIGPDGEAGSRVAVFTADRALLSTMLSEMQEQNLDPTAIEPDILCLARYLENFAVPKEVRPLFVVFSHQSCYMILPQGSHASPLVRSFIVGRSQNVTSVLQREIPLTLAAMNADEPVTAVFIAGENDALDTQKLAQSTGLDIETIELSTMVGAADAAKINGTAPAEFAMAYGAALTEVKHVRPYDFRRSFALIRANA